MGMTDIKKRPIWVVPALKQSPLPQPACTLPEF